MRYLIAVSLFFIISCDNKRVTEIDPREWVSEEFKKLHAQNKIVSSDDKSSGLYNLGITGSGVLNLIVQYKNSSVSDGNEVVNSWCKKISDAKVNITGIRVEDNEKYIIKEVCNNQEKLEILYYKDLPVIKKVDPAIPVETQYMDQCLSNNKSEMYCKKLVEKRFEIEDNIRKFNNQRYK